MTLDSRIGRSLNRLPAFPGTIHKVTSLINNPDSSLSELVEVIRLDQAITANILRICNSAYFGLRHKVDNVHDAIMYLGKQNVVRAVLAAGASRFFKDTPGYETEARELWEHAVATALMSQILARKILRREDQQLFTAALLHDIGKIILGEFVSEKYREIKNSMSAKSCSFLEAEEEVLGMNHAQIGGVITAAWHFPQDIQQAIAYHHRPDRHPATTSPMPWLIHLADQGCLIMGIGNGTDGLSYHGLNEAMSRFGFTNKDFEEAMSFLFTELDSARELIGIVQPKAV
jgi:putative nucleotidyltransferase with HDIG domain